MNKMYKRIDIKTVWLPMVALLFAMAPANAQSRSACSDLLWEQVGGRPSEAESEGSQFEIIDESRKGFLKITRTEEGCGCYGETTAAAYKGSDGSYTVLKTDRDDCASSKTVASNKALRSILPEGFGMHTFGPNILIDSSSAANALFYLDIAPPRTGTDTTVKLGYIPVGIRVSDSLLSLEGYGLIEGEHGPNYRFQDAFPFFFDQLQDSTALTHLINEDYRNLTPEDQNTIEKFVGAQKSLKNRKALSAAIAELWKAYKVYEQLSYDGVVLGWNREQQRFFIKEKLKKVGPSLSFYAFVKQLPYLHAIC